VVNDEQVKPVEKHFTAVAHCEALAIGKPFAYDESQYLHQVPGGVISNLRHQLRLIGKADKLAETLEEAARVRADFGYPIMVTPLSQFVVSQAAINVIVGERYKEVTDQVIQYALGHWGKDAPALLEPDVRIKSCTAREPKTGKGGHRRIQVCTKCGRNTEHPSQMRSYSCGSMPAQMPSMLSRRRGHPSRNSMANNLCCNSSNNSPRRRTATKSTFAARASR
jgi:hypothetical protein